MQLGSIVNTEARLAARGARLIDDETIDKARVHDSRDFTRENELWIRSPRDADGERVRRPEDTGSKRVVSIFCREIERRAATVYDAQTGGPAIDDETDRRRQTDVAALLRRSAELDVSVRRSEETINVEAPKDRIQGKGIRGQRSADRNVLSDFVRGGDTVAGNAHAADTFLRAVAARGEFRGVPLKHSLRKEGLVDASQLVPVCGHDPSV